MRRLGEPLRREWELLKTYCADRFRSCGAPFTLGKPPLLETNSIRSLRFLEVSEFQTQALAGIFRALYLKMPANAWVCWPDFITFAWGCVGKIARVKLAHTINAACPT
jgi:hypothetical protein